MIKRIVFNFLILMLLIHAASAQELNLSQKMDKYPDKEKVLNVAFLKHYPVFLIFYGKWCAESKSYLPVIKEVEKKWGGKILFITVDTEDKANQSLVDKYKKKYDLKYLPFTVVYDKSGKIHKEFTRSKPQKELEDIINEIVK